MFGSYRAEPAPVTATLGMQSAHHQIITPCMEGLILSVCISLSVCSLSLAREKHLIIHFYAQPRVSPAFLCCVHKSECRTRLFAMSTISTSQGKDSKLTPTFSIKCWPLPHKLSSYFRKRLVGTENKGFIKTSE